MAVITVSSARYDIELELFAKFFIFSFTTCPKVKVAVVVIQLPFTTSEFDVLVAIMLSILVVLIQ